VRFADLTLLDLFCLSLFGDSPTSGKRRNDRTAVGGRARLKRALST